MKKNVIVWAVDPFEENRLPMLRTAQELRGLIGKAETRVLPVYVRHQAWFEFPQISRLQVQSLADAELARARKAMSKRAGKDAVPATWSPVAIVQARDGSIRSQVNALLDFARENGADCIVTATHATRGVDRWLLGSFAETLIQRSRVPVYAINPHLKAKRKRSRKILFPTDISSESHLAFQQVLTHARESKSEIVLLHHFSFEAVPEPGAIYSLGSVYEQVSKDLLKGRKATLAGWVAEASQAGVRAKVIVDESSQPVAKVILKQSAQCDFIAMAAQSGPFTASLLGSTTRKVLREAKCPVWTLHAPASSTSSEQPMHAQAQISLSKTLI